LCALLFYYVSRSRSEFKSGLLLYKTSENTKGFLLSSLALGRNLDFSPS
jgi:hypothetical protein